MKKMTEPFYFPVFRLKLKFLKITKTDFKNCDIFLKGAFMKRVLIITVMSCFMAAIVFGQNRKIPDAVIKSFNEAGIQTVSEGVNPIDFTLPALDGSRINLAQLKGKVVFLNFWATWCGPCRSEMPSMEAIYKKFKNRGFEILAVNLGDSKSKVAAFMHEQKLTFTALLDEESVTGSYYHIRAIPTTYIIDRRGFIIARLTGSINWNTPKVIAAIEAALQN